MKQEDKFKELLLKDLCARLPYGVICDMWSKRDGSDKIIEVLKCGSLKRLMNSDFNFMVKPYLAIADDIQGAMSGMVVSNKYQIEIKITAL